MYSISRVHSLALILCALHSSASARSLWSTTPATYGNDSNDAYILKTGYLVGNGKLGAIPFGPPGAEKLVLNLDSLWSGGPFELEHNYTGGNPTEPVYEYLPGIREWIFQNGTGNVTGLLRNITGFGTYQALGNLSITLGGLGLDEETTTTQAPSYYTDYTRSLDLERGVHTTSWRRANTTQLLNTTLFCSYPAQSCVYAILATSSGNSTANTLPGPVTISLENQLMNSTLVNASCSASSGSARLQGITQAGIGMKFDAIARVFDGPAPGSRPSSLACSPDTPGLLVVEPAPGQASLAVVFSAESNYDQTKGTAAHNYSFRSPDDRDPGDVVGRRLAEIASSPRQSYERLLRDHVADYSSWMGLFTLDLPDTANSSALETSELVARYTANNNNTDITTTAANQPQSFADPFLEALLFDYARHLLVSSSREGSLPPNLQGVWTESLVPAWDGSYVTDVNVQMAYWGAEQTGLGGLAGPLFEFVADTWAPRGGETARLLYNGSGWVVHAEMNTFGYTGMEEVAMWTNYPASAAWIMQHVFDHYDYSRNLTWLAERGYPLLEAVASFWVSQLQEDLFFNDGTLVVNPCNSPEHGPTTFGCTHYGQVIHQVFEAVLSTAPLLLASPDKNHTVDTALLEQVASALARLDTGIHIDPGDPEDDPESSSTTPAPGGTAGALREWKVPDAYLYNVYPVHRHISHLVGWFPGYALSGFAGGYGTNATLQAAVRASLVARGDGTDLDGDGGDYGWPKVWRGACWARLNDSARAYGELRLSVVHNVAPNLLSMYGGGKSAPFQIDMNFGWAGNVLSMLVVDLPLAQAQAQKTTRTVVLGPAIPAAWGGGSVKGLRIRGGLVVDFGWDGRGVVTRNEVVSGNAADVRFVNVEGQAL